MVRPLPQSVNADNVLLQLQGYMDKDKVFQKHDLTIKSLSDIMGVKPYHLSRILNDELNMNFNSYINSYRIEQAKAQLAGNPDFTIIRIAYDAGFSSKSSFNSVFLEETGITPSEFRKAHKK